MDGRGHTLRRVGIARHSIVMAVIGLAAFVAFAGGLAVHGIMRQGAATEAARITAENEQLRALVTTLDEELPRARTMVGRASMTFAQLWSKSGLGPEPSALGVGPVEDKGSGESALDPYLSDVDEAPDMDDGQLPLELDRLLLQGPALQTELGALLEYFHDAERLLSNTPSIRPARTRWLTSGFGRRHDPMNGNVLMHKGVDLAGDSGDPIYAPGDGVVIFAGRRGGYGLTVVIDHGFGLQTHFAHLSRYRVGTGDVVKRGTWIADMGTTGKSTGPHLHYEVRRMGQPLDPNAFIMD